MSDTTVTNPGLVNVADQGDGLTVIDQAIATGPSTNAGKIAQAAKHAPGKGVAAPSPPNVTPAMTAQESVSAADGAPGLGTASPSPGDVTPAMTAQRSVDGGTASPVSPNTANTTANTVIGEPSSVQQYFKTINVYP
jgi:hypothetical protein